MNLLDDFKHQWNKPENGLTRIILINIVVFVFLGVVGVVSSIAEDFSADYFVKRNLYLPAPFSEFLVRPWTIVTYFFTHTGILHILFNMLFLFWFGRLLTEYLGNRKLINVYILGGLAGGAIYLLLFNLVPFFIARTPGLGMLGASASVYAVVVAVATLIPDYTFFLLFLGPVRIKYIAAFYIFISFLGSVGPNAGGNVAHLGGALMGYIFIRQLQKGNDLGKPLTWMAEKIKMLTSGSPVRVSYTNRQKSFSGNKTPDQKDIDVILDKISRSGYESLSKEEKEKLFRASQK